MAKYSQWHKAYKAKIKAKAKANCKCIKGELDDRSCIKPVMKKSKGAIEVNALNTTDSDVDPYIVDDAQPSQWKAQLLPLRWQPLSVDPMSDLSAQVNCIAMSRRW
jgi:hypothetical protein